MAFQRVLYPVDFSEHSELCLAQTVGFLEREGTREIHLIYVLHTPTDFSTWSGDPAAEVQQRLTEFAGELKPKPGVDTKSTVRTGHPSTEIAKYAAEHHCDLIVMATHGRTGLAHMLLGSTAEQVVRHAPCPVLTFRVTPSG